MVGGTEQALAFKLSMNFNQRLPQQFKKANADRLIIDEGPGATIRAQYPAQDQQVLIRRQTVFVEQGVKVIVTA